MPRELEPVQASDYHIRAYFKASWTVEELSESITVIYLTNGQNR